MKRNFFKNLALILLTIIFTIALTFASLELPEVTDNFISGKVDFVNVYTGGGDLQEIKAELFIRHYHLRTIGYISLIVVIVLIIFGFLTEKTGLTSLGAFAIFLPVFGHFAATMFFLGGLGFLRILWLPGLDISFDLMNLGDAVFIPYRILLDAFNFIGINLYYILPFIFIAIGLLLFVWGTLHWFNTYYQKSSLAKTGLYKFSRHPQYLGWIIWSYGILFLPGANMKQSYAISDSLPWLISTLIIIGVAMVEELKMSRIYGSEFSSYRKNSYFMIPFPRYFCKVISAPFRFFFKKQYPTKKMEILTVLAFYFILIISITVILNSSATMTAPGKWEFADKDTRSLEELSRAFTETPERRTKDRIVQTMIKKGDQAIPYFINLMEHNEPVVREFSADALGILKSEAAFNSLIAALQDGNRKVFYSVLNSIGNYRSDSSVHHLIKLLNNDDKNILTSICGALIKIGTEKAVKAVIPLAERGILTPNTGLIMALSKYPDERTETLLTRYLKENDINIKKTAVIAARNFSSPEIKQLLLDLSTDKDWEIRLYAEEVLNLIKDK